MLSHYGVGPTFASRASIWAVPKGLLAGRVPHQVADRRANAVMALVRDFYQPQIDQMAA